MTDYRADPVKLRGNDDMLNFSGFPPLWGYKTGEHLFQALKATTQKDHDYVVAASTAKEAKRRGRAIKLRPDWEQVKHPIMVAVLLLKFTRYGHLRTRLMDTGARPIQEARLDPVWGIGRDGKGQNLMGKALQLTRAVIRLTTAND